MPCSAQPAGQLTNACQQSGIGAVYIVMFSDLALHYCLSCSFAIQILLPSIFTATWRECLQSFSVYSVRLGVKCFPILTIPPSLSPHTTARVDANLYCSVILHCCLKSLASGAIRYIHTASGIGRYGCRGGHACPCRARRLLAALFSAECALFFVHGKHRVCKSRLFFSFLSLSLSFYIYIYVFLLCRLLHND